MPTHIIKVTDLTGNIYNVFPTQITYTLVTKRYYEIGLSCSTRIRVSEQEYHSFLQALGAMSES